MSKKLTDEAKLILQQTEGLLKTDKVKEKIVKEQIEEQEKQKVFFNLESLIIDKNSPEKIKELHEKIYLTGGNVTSKFQIKLLSKAVNSEPHFTSDKGFYQAICKILKLDPKIAYYYRKPRIFAILTNILIYGRFSSEVLLQIQELNPYISYCHRAHRNYHFIAESDLKYLDMFIYQAVDLLEKCNTLHQFNVEFFKLYGVSFQLDLFEPNV